MASRKEERAQARAERIERERAERARQSKQKRIRLAGGIGLVGAVIVAIVIATAGGGNSDADQQKLAASRPVIAPSQLAGVSASAGPWQPEYTGLVDRLTALQLPQPSDVAYHVHAILHVYVDGKEQLIPGNIGIDIQNNILSPLHTHDVTGVIHIEAAQKFPFRLGDFFDVWGVALTSTQLGSYQNSGDRTVHFYVNGKPLRLADPTQYLMKAHDNIVVAYGRDASFPTKPSAAALAGL